MAPELGMTPMKLGSIDNHRQEPEVVVSIEQRARQLQQQKADRKAANAARRSDTGVSGDAP
jgi:hypothetical protein